MTNHLPDAQIACDVDILIADLEDGRSVDRRDLLEALRAICDAPAEQQADPRLIHEARNQVSNSA